jgi:3-methyladenine DNA glycosylase AlkD
MHPEHRRLRASLQSLAGTGSAVHHVSEAYTGSPHRALGVTTPHLRRLARAWLAKNRAMTGETILDTADSLFAGDVLDEHILAALILGYSRSARRDATPARVDGWLDGLAGWAEVDALCANIFQAKELLADWAAWGGWIRRLAADANINKRRASLVLLTGPVRRSGDARLLEAALANVTELRPERAILITKAVSWLLRNLVARHRDVVARYLETDGIALPAIAAREVKAKLETGRKTRHSPGGAATAVSGIRNRSRQPSRPSPPSR